MLNGPSKTGAGLERRMHAGDHFGYRCHRCLHCCHDKRIQLNPYEVARLAQNRGVTTTDFRGSWTVDGLGVELARKETGACVFLGPEGCTVHADRPLVCRLYPLGRVVDPDGTERFVRAEPHPLSHGEFLDRGTIGEFLEAQKAAPFMRAADEYYFWFCRALEHRASLPDSATPPSSVSATGPAWQWLDMDSAIAAHCSMHGINEPLNLDERRTLHVQILDTLLVGSASGEKT
jgi:Fe-S-cluster containining protein